MTKKKDPADLLPVGRPSLYKPEYCEQVVLHMETGDSYEAFAAKIDVAYDTLYEWEKKHPEFSEAKKRGFTKNLAYWESVMKAGILGQLRRVTKETPIILKDKDGNETLATNPDGTIIMQTEYAATMGKEVTWIFMMKSRFPKLYRDQKNIALSGDGNGGAIKIGTEMSEEERIREILEMQKYLEEIGHGKPIIDVSPK